MALIFEANGLGQGKFKFVSQALAIQVVITQNWIQILNIQC
jgi:hypothetical protein